ncbi:glycosyltransferase family 9 protein [bacterium]|jgi:ADP-heptose:LPS heptosyltransferase|nr:glycosyltransferase family 9 protein [bacterium]
MINHDCRLYEGSKPCVPHKKEGVVCDDCSHYDPIQKRILIIKLGAMGDVLRTTALLHQLKTPGVEVTWITKSNSVPLLQSDYIDRVLEWGHPSLVPALLVETFDAIYSLDNDSDGAALAQLCTTQARFGYGINDYGKVYGYSEAATSWLETSINDTLKKANTRPYQEILFEICGLSFDPTRDTIILPSPWATQRADTIATAWDSSKRHWAVVLGAGPRWPQKSLALSKLKELLTLLVNNDIEPVLIAGPDEKEKCDTIRSWGISVVDTGFDNPITEVVGILDRCDVVITGDTLSMHIATGLKKRVYAFIGPTSADELADYGVMTKLVPDMDCLCCYLTDCPVDKKCNEIVSFDPLIAAETLTPV